MTYFQRCVPCGEDIPNGEMFEHMKLCTAKAEPRTPFHGKPNEPIIHRDVPKE